ncbi:MAG: hypothetical protein A4E63_02434 [Syntrophorhabdus sp. PtaU1.Bin050]|nr:MAG: hypothetical protein A4E63_02434 [Syntrophorhabdus sp. PtaU1.Bin050]
MRKSIPITVILFVLIPFLAVADPLPVNPGDYSGSRSTPWYDGVVATGDWSNGISISWKIIAPNSNSDLWSYTYTVDPVGKKDVGFSIFETGTTATSADFVFPKGYDVEGPKLWKEGGSSTDYMPADIYGIKFDFGGKNSATYSFQSTLAPVWGDFYSRDGKSGGITNTAFNVGFGHDPFSQYYTTPWIPTPGARTGVPEPSTAVLLILSMIGFGALKMEKQRLNKIHDLLRKISITR